MNRFDSLGVRTTEHRAATMVGSGAACLALGLFVTAAVVGCEGTGAHARRPTPAAPKPVASSSQPALFSETATVAFRAKASVLPGDSQAVAGKGPEEIVEIVLPGRVYDPPLRLDPPSTRQTVDRRTPENASASDFGAMRAGDPEWIRDNYLAGDYPSIKGSVEDPNLRKMNQGVFRARTEKAVVARCVYKNFELLFVRYDGEQAGGVVEVYQQVRGEWKRTAALGQDETLSLLQNMFRHGEVVQATR